MNVIEKRIVNKYIGLCDNFSGVHKLTKADDGVDGLLYIINDKNNSTRDYKIVTRDDDKKLPHLMRVVEEGAIKTSKISTFAKIQIPKNPVVKSAEPIVEFSTYGVQVTNDCEIATLPHHIIVGDLLEKDLAEPYGYLYLNNSKNKAQRMYRESIIYNASSIVFFEMLKEKQKQYKLLS